MMHPTGVVMTFAVADETYLHPTGIVVEGDIEAAAAGGFVHLAGYGGLAGHGGIAGPHGGLAG
jgi:hypothetical protein